MSSEERTILHREVSFELAPGGDGRTLEARIVPYGVPATVADPPTFEPYEEMFVRGAFDAQLKAAHRVKVWLNFEHEQGLRGIVGAAQEIESRDDGLYGTFRVHDNADGDKALQFVRDGLTTELSMEFAPLKSSRRNGVVERLRAHLDRVSLCRRGAFAGAEVLSLREEVIDQDDDEPKQREAIPSLEPISDDLAQSLEKLGLRVDTAKALRVKVEVQREDNSPTE
jgi:HK97 family phage prohead protease